jgi:hypothetical protein
MQVSESGGRGIRCDDGLRGGGCCHFVVFHLLGVPNIEAIEMGGGFEDPAVNC